MKKNKEVVVLGKVPTKTGTTMHSLRYESDSCEAQSINDAGHMQPFELAHDVASPQASSLSFLKRDRTLDKGTIA